MSIVLDGTLGSISIEESNSNENCNDNLDWNGIWQFAKDKTLNLPFSYKVNSNLFIFKIMY
jgi:hypothetical protein